jgi:NAD(P)-dependent dehydrogenase (short-subunit alcohol dehydrogenase family)
MSRASVSNTTSREIRLMRNKTVLITGSTDGIGQRCASDLAKSGMTVLIHGRNPDRGNVVVEQIKKSTGNDHIEFFGADFTSLKQVRQLAATIQQKHPSLDVLVNNAGTYMRSRQLSEDGFELTFAVNHLAPFVLTDLLLNQLKRNAPAKIINVSSMAHQSARLDMQNLQGEKGFDPYGAYAVSKLANLLFTYELANRLRGTNVTVNALHPGVIATKLLRAGFGSLGGRPVEDGAARILHLVSTQEIENVTGKYFVDDKEQKSSPQSLDSDLQKQFWALSEKLTGISTE